MYFTLKTSSTCFEQTSCSSSRGTFYCICSYWHASCINCDQLLAESKWNWVGLRRFLVHWLGRAWRIEKFMDQLMHRILFIHSPLSADPWPTQYVTPFQANRSINQKKRNLNQLHFDRASSQSPLMVCTTFNIIYEPTAFYESLLEEKNININIYIWIYTLQNVLIYGKLILKYFNSFQ